MPKTRKCAYCGKVFTTNSGMQKYCSEECAEQAKETRKKRQRNFLRAVEPVMELQQQEYLTFSKAAILLGCTRQYVYKLVEQGKLPASRLSSRMALVRRSDIEKMFEANPYNRVIPCSKPKLSTSKKQKLSSKKDAKNVQPTARIASPRKATYRPVGPTVCPTRGRLCGWAARPPPPCDGCCG